MDTEKLSGVLLYYWAAKATGRKVQPEFEAAWNVSDGNALLNEVWVDDGGGGVVLFDPAVDRGLGQGLADARGVDVISQLTPVGPAIMACAKWKAGGPYPAGSGWFVGGTFDEAVMRCVVADYFGYQVPDMPW